VALIQGLRESARPLSDGDPHDALIEAIRHSPRNQFVARQLAESGLATVLFDLLTPAEEERDRWTGELRFDVLLLANRLSLATQYVRGLPETRDLRVGYFGASTRGRRGADRGGRAASCGWGDRFPRRTA